MASLDPPPAGNHAPGPDAAPPGRAPTRAAVRLTGLTDCGGCAAKLGADLLADALAGLRGDAATDPDLLVGLEAPDDGAVYQVAPDLAIVGSVDFFPPLVDDPETYGAIAAANACSDIFAMGGRVLFAMSIAAFPETLPRDAMAAILAGAASTVRAAGGTLAGGHTIRDPEPKFGLAVVGVAHPARLLRKGGARPGDALVLTKPLGTGLLMSGRRRGRTGDDDLAAAVASMRTLNLAASEVLVRHAIVGATDITGFGLLGHAAEMARAAGPIRLAIETASLPALAGAVELARAGIETDGAAHNRRAAADILQVAEGVDPALAALAFDPQTSGGLLAAVPAGSLEAVLADLRAAGVSASGTVVVGHVEASAGPMVALR